MQEASSKIFCFITFFSISALSFWCTDLNPFDIKQKNQNNRIALEHNQFTQTQYQLLFYMFNEKVSQIKTCFLSNKNWSKTTAKPMFKIIVLWRLNVSAGFCQFQFILKIFISVILKSWTFIMNNERGPIYKWLFRG